MRTGWEGECERHGVPYGTSSNLDRRINLDFSPCYLKWPFGMRHLGPSSPLPSVVHSLLIPVVRLVPWDSIWGCMSGRLSHLYRSGDMWTHKWSHSVLRVTSCVRKNHGLVILLHLTFKLHLQITTGLTRIGRYCCHWSMSFSPHFRRMLRIH